MYDNRWFLYESVPSTSWSEVVVFLCGLRKWRVTCNGIRQYYGKSIYVFTSSISHILTGPPKGKLYEIFVKDCGIYYSVKELQDTLSFRTIVRLEEFCDQIKKIISPNWFLGIMNGGWTGWSFIIIWLFQIS